MPAVHCAAKLLAIVIVLLSTTTTTINSLTCNVDMEMVLAFTLERFALVPTNFETILDLLKNV